MTDMRDQQASDYAKLQRSLTNITPTDVQVIRIEHLRQVAKSLGTEITMGIQPGRERSLAVTKLEECVMWAVKAILMEDKTPVQERIADIRPDNGIIGTGTGFGS